jgi:GDP-4-dehydro-6-deoxy-D-mannose reductase
VNRALITGGRGFAGTALATHLRDNGWHVTTADRHDAALGQCHRRLDVTDADAFARLVTEVKPDVVFHLAALTPQRLGSYPMSRAAEIVAGTLGACQAVLAAAARPRLVLAGSSAQYGPVPRADNPIREETTCRPDTGYGMAKLAAETTAFALSSHLDVLPVRAFNHIGPGQPAFAVAGAFAARTIDLLHGRARTLTVGDAEVVRDFTDVRDLARGYRAVAERGITGRVYHLCSGRPTTIRALAEVFLDVAGLAPTLVTLQDRPEPASIRYQVGCCDRAARELAWQATTTLRTSIRDMLTTLLADADTGTLVARASRR